MANTKKIKTKRITVPFDADVYVCEKGMPLPDNFVQLMEGVVAARLQEAVVAYDQQKNRNMVAMTPKEVSDKVVGLLRGLHYSDQTAVIGRVLNLIKTDRQLHYDSIERSEAQLTSNRRVAQQHVQDLDNLLMGNFTVIS